MTLSAYSTIIGSILDVLYAIHQLTITFVTYIFKITSLYLRSYFSGARAKKVFCKKTHYMKIGHHRWILKQNTDTATICKINNL